MSTILLKKRSIAYFRLVIILSTQIGTAGALNLSINDSQDLRLVGNIVYNYQSTPSTFSFQVDDPIVCTSISASNPETIIIDANDGNNLALTTMNHNASSILYNPTNGRVNISTDNTIQCATQNDTFALPSLLFVDGFETNSPILNNDLQLSLDLLKVNGVSFTTNTILKNQDVITYQYNITNNGANPLDSDVVEFYKLDNTEPYFSDVNGQSWGCITANTAIGSTTQCGSSSGGNGFVRLTNAIVEPGEKLVVNVSRTVEIPNGATLSDIKLLVAAFATNHHDSNFANNVAFKQFNL